MIKSIFKIFIAFIIILFIFSIAFYFYSSSANLEKNDYVNIKGVDQRIVQKDTFKIITYNLGYLSGMTNNTSIETDESFFRKNQQRLIDFLQSEKVDIIAFQEIDYHSQRSFLGNQIDSVRLLTPFNFSAMTVNWDKKYVPFPYWPLKRHFGEIVSGQAVASVFPVLENKRIILDKRNDVPFYYNAFYLDRMIQVVKLKINQKEIMLLNVHLEAFDQITREKQSLKVLEIYNKLVDEYPVILLGDFNANAEFENNEQTIANIMKGKNIARAISDSLYRKDKESQYTYNSVNPNRKIDYIFYNKEKINFISAGVLEHAGDISDHIPVMMNFSVR